MYGKTREEAVLLLLGLREHVSLLVQHRPAGRNLQFQTFQQYLHARACTVDASTCVMNQFNGIIYVICNYIVYSALILSEFSELFNVFVYRI